MSTYRLDAENRLLVFTGPCLDSIGVCRAMCCRKWDVAITDEEARSGIFEWEPLCRVTQTACGRPNEQNCFNRLMRLKKKADGSCMYLDSECRCSIYENRPDVCRKFSCAGGWELVRAKTPHPAAIPSAGHENTGGHETQPFSPDFVCILNPLITVKTVFEGEPAGTLILVCNHVSRCAPYPLTVSVPGSLLSADAVHLFIQSFDGQAPAEKLVERACAIHGGEKIRSWLYRLAHSLIAAGVIIFKQERLPSENARMSA